MRPPLNRRHGYRWRLLAHTHIPEGARTGHSTIEMEFGPKNRVLFDELVIFAADDAKDGERRMMIHLEQMDDGTWWMSVGDAAVWVTAPSSGPIEVNITRGEYGPVCGETDGV